MLCTAMRNAQFFFFHLRIISDIYEILSFKSLKGYTSYNVLNKNPYQNDAYIFVGMCQTRVKFVFNERSRVAG